MIVEIVIETLWFAFPACVANTMPVFASRYNWLQNLNLPIDGGRTYRSVQILGENKTWRGVVVGVIFGAITGLLQHILYRFEWIQMISIESYESITYSLLLGSLLGFGALLGDAVKSFFKRRLHVAAGASWKPFDQIDSIIGAFVVTLPIATFTLMHVVIGVISFGILSYITSAIGVGLGIKKSL